MAKLITTTQSGTVLTVTVEGHPAITVDTATLSDTIREQAMYHGLKQKICDAAALSRDTTTGQSATPAEKHAAMQAVAANLVAGVWNAGRAEGGGMSREATVLQALANVYGMDMAWAEAKIVATMTKKGIDRKAAVKLWGATEKVAAEVERLKPKPKANLDADELMAELDKVIEAKETEALI